MISTNSANKSPDRHTKNNKTFGLILVLLAAVIFLGFSLLKSIKKNDQLKALLPYLLPGEKIEDLALICVDEKDQDITSLERGRIHLLYVFPRTNCTACVGNEVRDIQMGDLTGKQAAELIKRLRRLNEELSYKRRQN
jgi:hypothetical protein